jgi:hypothetical protein
MACIFHIHSLCWVKVAVMLLSEIGRIIYFYPQAPKRKEF